MKWGWQIDGFETSISTCLLIQERGLCHWFACGFCRDGQEGEDGCEAEPSTANMFDMFVYRELLLSLVIIVCLIMGMGHGPFDFDGYDAWHHGCFFGHFFLGPRHFTKQLSSFESRRLACTAQRSSRKHRRLQLDLHRICTEFEV